MSDTQPEAEMHHGDSAWPVASSSEPHIHEPEGPGEYCTGCFEQGVAWSKYEERARIIGIIEDSDLHTGAKRYLTALIRGGQHEN